MNVSKAVVVSAFLTFFSAIIQVQWMLAASVAMMFISSSVYAIQRLMD